MTDLGVTTDAKGNKNDAAPAACNLAAIDDVVTICESAATAAAPVVADQMARKSKAPSHRVHSLWLIRC